MKPLHGLRILDLSRVVSGPFCTMLLGDLGADVIKVEEPAAGDDARAFGPPFVNGESAYFLSVNRNKRSVAIDLKSAGGRELLLELVAQVDVLVDNFRPGTMERLGLGPQTLRARNPRLIHCAITGFGRCGLDRDRPGYDLIIQGESGVMDITGAADGPPTKVGTSIADLVTGLYAAMGVLAAIVEHRPTAPGHAATEGHAAAGNVTGTVGEQPPDRTAPDSWRVDISMLDCMASLLTFNAGTFFATGRSPQRRGNLHPSIAPYETFRTADGWINLGVANDKFWRLFCIAIGRPELSDDPRFAAAPDRVTHREQLIPLIQSRLLERSRDTWIDTLQAAGVPCGAIRTVGEVCETSTLAERGMITTTYHPVTGEVRSIVSPFRFGDVPLGEHRPAPLLGEHTAELLSALCGRSATEIATLAADGVVGLPSTRPLPPRPDV